MQRIIPAQGTFRVPRNMEAYGALSLVREVFDQSSGTVAIETIVLDDDSLTRALLKHPSTHPKGLLPEHIPEPSFLVDPSHRTKVVAKAIFALVHLPKSQSKCTNIDALRIKKYHGYMLKQSRNLTLEEITNNCKAVIEHLFDNHEYCDVAWCKPKRIKAEVQRLIETNYSPTPPPLAQTVSREGQDLPPSPGPPQPTDNNPKANAKSTSFYHSKETDIDLYNQLVEAYSRFTTPDRLIESLHPFDTQLNESLHHVVAKYAPKHKNYSTTMALSNRISIVVGIHNLGHATFWSRVYAKLGMKASEDLIETLTNLDREKKRKKEYNERHENKLKRVANQIEKMATMMKKQKKDQVQGATYGAGIGLQNIVPSEVAKIEMEKKQRNKVSCVWFGCNVKRHKSNRNKQCRYHTCSSKEEIECAVDKVMRETYPEYYGELHCIVIFRLSSYFR